jgi:hypothetical protein
MPRLPDLRQMQQIRRQFFFSAGSPLILMTLIKHIGRNNSPFDGKT